MAADSFKGPVRCGRENLAEVFTDTVTEVTTWIRQLRVAGWTMTRIAVAMDCNEGSLRNWRDGKVSMPVDKWKRLKALAESVGKRRVG